MCECRTPGVTVRGVGPSGQIWRGYFVDLGVCDPYKIWAVEPGHQLDEYPREGPRTLQARVSALV